MAASALSSGIDHPGVVAAGEPDEAVENVVGLMMFTVHVEEHPGPELAALELVQERFHPKRFDEEEIQTTIRAGPLDAMDEPVIRIELVRHHQVVGPHAVR